MDDYKKLITKIVISCIAVFVLGITIGYEINNGSIKSLQGYLFRGIGNASNSNASTSNASTSNASTSNASTSNASTSNASTSNASTSNASSSNASSANAKATDGIIFLNAFSLKESGAKQGDRINVNISTTGACNSGASVVFEGTEGIFSAQIRGITTDEPYIIIPETAVAGKYSVTSVLLIGKNSDGSTFTKQYTKNGANAYNFDSTVTIASKNDSKNEIQSVRLQSIALKSDKAKIGDKVYLDLKTTEKLTSLKLTFVSTDNKTLIAYANDLSTNKPYIDIPNSTKEGTYSLTGAILLSSKGSTTYGKEAKEGVLKYDFNSVLTIEKEETEEKVQTVFVYNNEDINDEILSKLYSAPKESEITINAESNTLVNEGLFDAIKGTDKKLIINSKGNQLVFSGNDVDTSKTIDVNISVDKVSNNEKINKFTSRGIVVNFPDNGSLPGKALVRIKATEMVEDVLEEDVFVYVYNESTDNFCEIDTAVKKTKDGYYEFMIDHNTDFLIVNKKLDNSVVVASADRVVGFQKGRTTQLLLIGCGALVVVGAIIVLVVLKNKQNNPKKKKTK